MHIPLWCIKYEFLTLGWTVSIIHVQTYLQDLSPARLTQGVLIHKVRSTVVMAVIQQLTYWFVTLGLLLLPQDEEEGSSYFDINDDNRLNPKQTAIYLYTETFVPEHKKCTVKKWQADEVRTISITVWLRSHWHKHPSGALWAIFPFTPVAYRHGSIKMSEGSWSRDMKAFESVSVWVPQRGAVMPFAVSAWLVRHFKQTSKHSPPQIHRWSSQLSKPTRPLLLLSM